MFIRHNARWIFVVFVLLVIAFPAGSGPAYYLVGRGWLSYFGYYAMYGPLDTRVSSRTPLGGLYHNYRLWWNDLGWKHSGRRKVEMESGGWSGPSKGEILYDLDRGTPGCLGQ